jgi:SAM-dependent methyltransferase
MNRTEKPFIATRAWISSALKSVNDLRCKVWDVMHAVDTCGDIPLALLDFPSASKTEGLEYHSHHPRLTRAALRAVNINHPNYTFIDFGCGKGRVILLASDFPYRKIVGLEFAPQLAETAEHNIRKYRHRSQKCTSIEVLCTDVVDYKLPLEPEVLYFYNPFKVEVMQRVAEEIEQSLKQAPRDIWVVQTGPMLSRDRSFGALRRFQCLRRERYFDIYRCVVMS